ncbi:DgyrCDS395 [Dimorphilus gyrociliatus]|uniref:DgyrCDS395 n=1 Tax=Dimorphilus gyrociliatus TaxID=2664684 RepID=A0A7I8V4I3_9ANNE|nr:DgyrCDS395 [Dimorphilus gyrociliatus]
MTLIFWVSAEIHRAKKFNSRHTRRFQREPITILGHDINTWFYSLIAAALVGLSGIFPLLVIPLEIGKNLKKGASADRLQLLLSFAVGSLLGDVFFHLLPEAWAHIPHDESGKIAIRKVGFWVLCGLLGFWLIEKIFPDDDEEKEDNSLKRDVNCDKNDKASFADDDLKTKANLKKRKINDRKNLNDKSEIRNENISKIFVCFSNVFNFTSKGKRVQKRPVCKTSAAEDNTHIKTTGWLNLIANVIDNFTHGLAVAGSFCVSNKVGFITTFAILLHEIPHEVGDFAILLRSGFDRWRAAKAQMLTATGGMIGAIVALCSESAEKAGNKTAWVLPFTSGGFLYIALLSILPDLLKETNIRKNENENRLLNCYKNEIKSILENVRIKAVRSVFFGGGTPSLAEPKTIKGIITEIVQNVEILKDHEFTLEINPTNVESNKLNEFKNSGINRLSIGVQSLNAEDLFILNRNHSRKDALRISVDLMFGLPNQNIKEWENQLKLILEMGVNHISLYQLTLERGTALFKLWENDKLNIPKTDEIIDMYEISVETCKSYGLSRYEVSNFSLKEYESIHNKSYWQGLQYAGIGPGAHSRLMKDCVRHSHIQTLEPEPWMREVEKYGHGTRKIVKMKLVDVLIELLVLGLRTEIGLNSQVWDLFSSIKLTEMFDNEDIKLLVDNNFLILDEM